MASPILWQNKEQTVALIDIPRSIAAAQGGAHFTISGQLLSSEPLRAPFPTNEPKTAKAKANLQGNTVDAARHEQYEDILQRALRDISCRHEGDWCLPRPCVAESGARRPMKKRKLDHRDEATWEQDTVFPPEVEEKKHELPPDFLPSLTRPHVGRTNHQAHNSSIDCSVDRLVPIEDAAGHVIRIHNCTAGPLSVALSNDHDDEIEEHNFYIPPDATAFLADCWNSQTFHQQPRHSQKDTVYFDFILLDPPWPNRSVKRTHKTPGSTYKTLATLPDLEELLLNMDLPQLMAQDCLVGIWITNKPTIRELILGPRGIFDAWSLDLVEEWLWLKTTIHGEPVTPLDSLWRKPYEVLLLGRKRQPDFPHATAFDITHVPPRIARTPNEEASPSADNLPATDADRPPHSLSGSCTRASDTRTGILQRRRRIIFSVPDLHSRKPCLKELIEPLIPNSRDDEKYNYRALEVFARHLVAGWWSWGNECLKFNWEGYWRKVEGN